MPCYHPVTGYYGKSVNPKTGRRPLVFNISQAFSGVKIDLPCGKCIGCRLERSRQWAVRIMHEKRIHEESAFLTLTYNDQNLPHGGTLVLRDLQLFMKRLRKKRETGLRFYACGEYGETSCRPHYHVLLLNTSFTDMRHYKKSGNFDLYVSAELSSLWTAGEHWIGNVTFESAAYVARYVTKKITGPMAEGHYQGRAPEFVCMSRRPGIGYGWFQQFQQEAYRSDSVIMNGKECKIPRYYDTKFEVVDGKRFERIKGKRRRKAMQDPDRKNVDRRRVKEIVTSRAVDVYGRGDL